MTDFKIGFLDHVAITVKDLEVSAKWYEQVLGLKKYKLEKWGEFPVFMLAGKTGVALFPENKNDSEVDSNTIKIKIDHFAFNVDKENFELAKVRLTDLGVNFDYKNHHYFESIYMDDPDGHCVELTTILIPEKDFYLD